MSISNILGTNGKIINGVLPDPYPFPASVAGLGEVLAVNSSAANPITTLPQNATDFDLLGCKEIATGKVFQFNNLSLQIGDPTDTLVIKGATAKGSILVGDGLKTESLVVPSGPPLPNGSVLILDDTTALGVRWGGESGDIKTITPGNNIDITGTSANAIVAFQSPTTSDIVLGPATKIVAKDNYTTPNFTTEIDATGFNATYSQGGVINQEDIAVSSTSVQQILSTTNTSDYINSATLTCDTNFISDVRSSQILTSGLEKSASVSITTNVSSSQPNAGIGCGVSAPTTSPFPDINANIGMSCPDTSTPQLIISQSAPFAVSYQTTIDKNGINSNNSGGVAPLTINSNTQPLALTTTDNITFSADNIDLSSTGRLIVPSLASGDYLDFDAGKLSIINDSVGGSANPLLVLQNNNATAGGVVVETYKNDPPTATGGDVISALSSYTNALVAGVATKVEMTRISSIAQGVGTNNNDGTIALACKVNSSLAPQNFLVCNGGIGTGEIVVSKPLDMTGNTIKTSTGDMTISTTASVGTGNLDVITKGVCDIIANGGASITGGTGLTASGATFTSGITLSSNSADISMTAKQFDLTTQPTAPATAFAALYLDNTGGVEINCDSTLTFTGAGLQSATAGGNSGQHLVITLNGVQYKIKLENP